MNEQIVGKCSKCGGDVININPQFYAFLVLYNGPSYKCISCGANEKKPEPKELPTIEME